MRLISLIVLLLCVSEFSVAADLEEDVVTIERSKFTCGNETINKINYRYCLRNPEHTNSKDIIYFFHGLTGDEESWFRMWWGTLIIQKWWEFWGYKPRIATISFGGRWLLNDTKKSKLSTFVSTKVIPSLEKKMGGLQDGQRHAIGQSMGGFNAAHLSLKNPGLFNRVALLCPALSTVSPHASQQEVKNYIRRTRAFPFLVRKMINISREVFPTLQEWKDNDPMYLLKNYKSTKRSKFLVSIGLADSYGFQEGSRQFVQMAQGKSIFSSWLPVPGPHCMFNRRTTAHFIKGD
ncbi:alpha/beta fold hydrolase [Bdellovibrio bacteriovorus]